MNQKDSIKEMNLNIKLEDLEPVKCKRCRSEVFEQAFAMRRLSSLLSPDGKEKYVTVPVLVCLACKEVFIPEQSNEETLRSGVYDKKPS